MLVEIANSENTIVITDGKSIVEIASNNYVVDIQNGNAIDITPNVTPVDIANVVTLVDIAPTAEIVEVGITGLQGIQGVAGANGANGAGLPTGGALGQLIKKASAADYDTHWIDATPSYPFPEPLGNNGESLLVNKGALIFSEDITMPRATRVDDAGSGVTYIGEADAGTSEASASWRIKRITEVGADISIDWADGDTDFDNVWANRIGLSYS